MNPRVAVVVPALDAAATIGATLRSLLAQDVEGLVVLVVDGRSVDGTRDVVRAVATTARLDGRAGAPVVELLDNPGRTAPMAMNIGLARVQELDVPYWGRLDAHARLEAGALRTLLETLAADPGIGCVGPALVTTPGRDRGGGIAHAMTTPFGVGPGNFRTADRGDGAPRVVDVDTVAFGLHRTTTLDVVGTFDPALRRNQDDEFNARLRRHGLRVVQHRDARAVYAPRADLRSLARQMYGYGRFKPRVHRATRDVRPRHLAPAALVAGLVASWVARRRTAAPLRGLATLWTVAATVSSRGSSDRPGTVAAYAVMHLAYGCGYLVGVAAELGRARG